MLYLKMTDLDKRIGVQEVYEEKGFVNLAHTPNQQVIMYLVKSRRRRRSASYAAR